MNTTRLMAFKNENRVDWPKTQENIRAFVVSKSNGSISADAMWAAEIERDLRRWVKQFTVKNCYYTWKVITGQEVGND